MRKSFPARASAQGWTLGPLALLCLSAPPALVETNNRDSFFDALLKIILETGMEIHEMTSPDDNLQAVFDYLIGK